VFEELISALLALKPPTPAAINFPFEWNPMEQRVSVVTLAVGNLEHSRQFYEIDIRNY
jgi:hypothetical protein